MRRQMKCRQGSYYYHYCTTLHQFNGLFSSITWVSRYQKGKTCLDLNKARDYGVCVADGSGISWTICKQSAARSRQIPRVVHGSILCDPIQPNPTHYKWKKFGPNPTRLNTTNNGAYSLVVTYFYAQNFIYLLSTRPNPTDGSTEPMDNSSLTRTRFPWQSVTAMWPSRVTATPSG